MKRSKILTVIAAAAMCLVFSITASAVTTADIISKLQNYGASATQIAQAQDFLKSVSSEFTTTQLDTVSSNIDEIANIMKTNNVTDITKLPAAAKDQVKSIVLDTASSVGITAQFGQDSSGVPVLTLIKDGVPYTFAGNDTVAKTTGSNLTVPAAVLALGMLLAAGSAAYILANRRKAAAR